MFFQHSCQKFRLITSLKVYSNFLLIAMIMASLFCGCQSNLKDIQCHNVSFPNELVHFAPYKNNPVFAGSGDNKWDKNIRERGFILKGNDQYYLWYTGYNDNFNEYRYLGLATSKDGINWKRFSDKPIHEKDWVEDVFVTKAKNKYYMVAEGKNDVAKILVSVDRINWVDLGNIELSDTTGKKIHPPYGTPVLWIENDKWRLFYEIHDNGIWVAELENKGNLLKWKNIRDDPVIKMGPEHYDKAGLALDQIIKYKGCYYAYYHGSSKRPGNWSVNVAGSNDMINWQKYPNNPIVGDNRSSGIIVNTGEKVVLYTMHPDVRLYLPEENK